MYMPHDKTGGGNCRIETDVGEHPKVFVQADAEGVREVTISLYGNSFLCPKRLPSWVSKKNTVSTHRRNACEKIRKKWREIEMGAFRDALFGAKNGDSKAVELLYN